MTVFVAFVAVVFVAVVFAPIVVFTALAPIAVASIVAVPEAISAPVVWPGAPAATGAAATEQTSRKQSQSTKDGLAVVTLRWYG
jgi:hypothetical protein